MAIQNDFIQFLNKDEVLEYYIGRRENLFLPLSEKDYEMTERYFFLIWDRFTKKYSGKKWYKVWYRLFYSTLATYEKEAKRIQRRGIPDRRKRSTASSLWCMNIARGTQCSFLRRQAVSITPILNTLVKNPAGKGDGVAEPASLLNRKYC
jgi:hypothetical protein